MHGKKSIIEFYFPAPHSERKIMTVNGLAAHVIGDGRVRIRGDLGLMSKAAAMDADLLFENRDRELQGKYGMSGREVIYYWWTAYDDLVRRYIQLNRPSEADFADYLSRCRHYRIDRYAFFLA
jgi:hypothetical protein